MAENIGLDLFGEPAYKPARSMKDFFTVPPFSVLDTTDKFWRARKKRWLLLTGDLSESRDEEYGKLGGDVLWGINGGTSNFDPVLAELMLKWFCPPSGVVLDPFGGEQTKGVVAGELGFRYHGIEYRQEQVDINRAAVAHYGDGIRYERGDSNHIAELIPARGFDLCFTSPPYYDREVYSKDDLSAIGTYAEFMAQYKNIFRQCFDMLADNRFCIVKIGEIRDKKTGIYQNFVGDNIRIMQEVGFKYYNEIILLNAVGSLPTRTSKQMNASRKIGKRHQNVLVFLKGDPEALKTDFPELMPDNKYYDSKPE